MLASGIGCAEQKFLFVNIRVSRYKETISGISTSAAANEPTMEQAEFWLSPPLPSGG
jgi:hypothetical protein